jgi:hypothetical protein
LDHDAVADNCRNVPVPKPFERSADRFESGERVVGIGFRRWFIALLRRLEAIGLLASHRDPLRVDTKKGLETSDLASNPLGYVRLMRAQAHLNQCTPPQRTEAVPPATTEAAIRESNVHAISF